MEKTRRRLLQGMAATGFVAGASTWGDARAQGMQPDLILRNGQFTTLDRSNPQADAVAIKDGRFIAVGLERDVMVLAGSGSKVIDLKGRRAVPGLIDSHMHIIRGGLNYNMELRWDGVRSLGDAMRMLKEQVARTPAPQWVRVVGGFTAQQFAEKRLPTLDEINAVAPDTPVFLLHLYDRALLNGAAVRAVGYTKDTPDFPGGEIVRGPNGEPTGLLIAKPNATILYATLAKGPNIASRIQEEFDAAFHARDKPSWRDWSDRRRRWFPELPRRLPDYRGAAPRGTPHGAHCVQPLYAKAEAGAAGLRDLGQAGAPGSRRRYLSQQWRRRDAQSIARRTMRTSRSNVPTCRPRWRLTSSR